MDYQILFRMISHKAKITTVSPSQIEPEGGLLKICRKLQETEIDILQMWDSSKLSNSGNCTAVLLPDPNFNTFRYTIVPSHSVVQLISSLDLGKSP